LVKVESIMGPTGRGFEDFGKNGEYFDPTTRLVEHFGKNIYSKYGLPLGG